MVNVVRPAKKQAILMTFSEEGLHTETFRVLTPNMPLDGDVVTYLALTSARADKALEEMYGTSPSPMLEWAIRTDASRAWGRYESVYQHLVATGKL